MRFRGKGSLNEVSLIVVVPEGSEVVRGGKATGKMIETQVDQSLMNPEKVKTGEQQKTGMKKYVKTGEAQNVADTNPYLNSKNTKVEKGVDGKPYEYVDHKTYYTMDQIDAITKAAGDKAFKMEKGGRTFDVYGVKADLLFNSNNETVINTKKPMAPTANKQFGKDVFEKQEAVTKAAKEYRDNNLEEYKEVMNQKAPDAEAEPKEVSVKSNEAEMDAPNI